MNREKLKLPTWMIHQSFRYCLGRRTYAVSVFVNWALANIEQMPESEKQIIKRELREAFEREDRLKLRGSRFSPIGDKCDREQWQKLLEAL